MVCGLWLWVVGWHGLLFTSHSGCCRGCRISRTCKHDRLAGGQAAREATGQADLEGMIAIHFDTLFFFFAL